MKVNFLFLFLLPLVCTCKICNVSNTIFFIQVSTTQIAEHLVSAVVEESDLIELGKLDVQARQQLEIDIERLHSRLEHTRAQNNVLTLSLEECKSQADK